MIRLSSNEKWENVAHKWGTSKSVAKIEKKMRENAMKMEQENESMKMML